MDTGEENVVLLPPLLHRAKQGYWVALHSPSHPKAANATVLVEDYFLNQLKDEDIKGRRIFQVTLGIVLVGIIFYAGIYFTQNKLWPYRPIARAFGVLEDGIKYGVFAPQYSIADAPAGSSREVYTVYDKDAVLPGFRAIMGYQPENSGFGIRIYDTDGNLVNERVIDYATEDPDGPSAGSDAPHAFHFMKDGSVLVNFDKGDLLGRFDVCGKAVWSRDGVYHHSFDADPAGGIWTWRGDVSAFSQYQYLVLFDPDTGESIREIGLVEDIITENPEIRTLFSLAPGHVPEKVDSARGNPDLFHPNDLEVLTEDMAPFFPQFEVGDLLLSFRNIDMVAVMDPESLKIRWWAQGPWIQQHDPDFTRTGEISVYNNNRGRGGKRLSSIVLINPETRAVRTVELDDDYTFYSSYMGKHEYLDNDALQIAVPWEGRALEFDKNGKLILEMNNVLSEKFNAFVADYTWLPEDFFDIPVDQLTCETPQS